jgi:hypothetical protein
VPYAGEIAGRPRRTAEHRPRDRTWYWPSPMRDDALHQSAWHGRWPPPNRGHSCAGLNICGPQVGRARGASRRSRVSGRARGQWVLSLPHRLRDVLAWDHALCRARPTLIVSVFIGHRPVPIPQSSPKRVQTRRPARIEVTRYGRFRAASRIASGRARTQ